MKKIFVILFTLLTSISFAQVKVGSGGNLIPTGNYPVANSEHVKGGVHLFKTIIERDALPDNFRDTGMLGYVTDSSKFYYLKDGISNTDWTVWKGGGCDTCIAYSTMSADSLTLYLIRQNGDTAQAYSWVGTDVGGGSGSSDYILPVASSSILGGVKIGDGLNIDGSGVLNATVSSVPSLQQVTDVGNTITNDIIVQGTSTQQIIVGNTSTFYGVGIGSTTTSGDGEYGVHYNTFVGGIPRLGSLLFSNLNSGSNKTLQLPNISGTLTEGITDGTTTVHAGTDGIVDISSLLGGGGGGITQSQLDDSTASAKAFSWNLTGNSGTTSNNFIGTTDYKPLEFRVYNHRAGYIGDTTFNKVSFGYRALERSTMYLNVAFGNYAAQQTTTGNSNTAIGFNSLWVNADGSNNTAIGSNSLQNIQSGNNNTMVGQSAGYALILSASDNIGIGHQSMGVISQNNISGNHNIAIGYNSLVGNGAHSYNIGLGNQSGVYDDNGSEIAQDSTLFLSRSTKHMYFTLDSVSSSPPSVIGKDENGFWHTYAPPPTITSGTSAPSSTPGKVGDIYVDITAKKLYFATGTSSSSDWIIAN